MSIRFKLNLKWAIACIGVFIFAATISTRVAKRITTLNLLDDASSIPIPKTWFWSILSYHWISPHEFLVLVEDTAGEPELVRFEIKQNLITQNKLLSEEFRRTMAEWNEKWLWWSIAPDGKWLLLQSERGVGERTERKVVSLSDSVSYRWPRSFGASKPFWTSDSSGLIEIGKEGGQQIIRKLRRDGTVTTVNALSFTNDMTIVGWTGENQLLVKTQAISSTIVCIPLDTATPPDDQRSVTLIDVPAGYKVGLILASPKGDRLVCQAIRESVIPKISRASRFPFFKKRHAWILSFWVCDVDGSNPVNLGEIEAKSAFGGLQWLKDGTGVSFVYGQSLWIKSVPPK